MVNPAHTPGGEIKFFNVLSGYPEEVRTPTIFKIAELTSLGRSVVWDPPPDYRCRVLGVAIAYGGATIAAKGRVVLTLFDGAAPILKAATTLDTSPTIQPPFIVNFPGNGYLADVNRSLEIDMSAAIVTNQIFVNLWGTEE